MGVSHSWNQLGAKFAICGEAIATAANAATHGVAAEMKTVILAGANGPKKTENWIAITVLGSKFELLLRGGFAYLTEKGSYKQPQGYLVGPKKVTARRIKNAEKKGVTLAQKSVVASADKSFIAAYAHHPAIKERPFWAQGIATSAPLVAESYQRLAVESVLRKVF